MGKTSEVVCGISSSSGERQDDLEVQADGVRQQAADEEGIDAATGLEEDGRERG